ncbi:MAG TPA: PQQ-binding-like beta-propeller repeat protein [Candidatus Sulfotelmatobacter sp.]|nr:PQQ-binding-like beta-propeller repeat protein [Candidatus Sulfotelmatobacter sp.]
MHNLQKLAIAIIVLLMASITLITTAVQPTQAQLATTQPTSGSLPAGVTPDLQIDTIPFVSFRPNLVGVGQTILVNLWLQPATNVQRQHIDALKVTLTKPDGTKDTIGPLTSYCGDTTAWFEYIADQVGTWKIKFDFLGMYFPAGRYLNGKIVTNTSGTGLGSVYYKPSTTAEYEFTVQQDTVASWPPVMLPTDYWTRPISPENREWWIIGGNYPFSGPGGGNNWPANTNIYGGNYKFTPYVQAPNSAHIVWKRQGALGGIIGGQFGTMILGSGEGTYSGTPSIIFQGRAYQTITKPMSATVNGSLQSVATTVFECYDIRTGEVYWDLTGITAPTAIETTFRIPVVPGATQSSAGVSPPTLLAISNRLIKYNAFTGAVTLNASIAPLTSGTYFTNGYALSVQSLGGGKYCLINWTTAGTSESLASRIISNVTWPFSSLGTCDYETGVSVTTMSYTPNATGVSTDVYIQAVNMVTGQLLWNISANVGYPVFSGSTACADHGKFAVRFDDGHWHCWDLLSGKKLWVSEMSSYPWGTFGAYNVASAYGLLYWMQYDGIVAYDWENGEVAWKYEAPTNPYETPYTGGNGTTVSPFFTNAVIADGKVYSANGEHSPTTPLTRGWRLHCINATTGTGIWNISGGGTPGAIADGYLTFDSRYTGYMYVFGKGKSSTTVTSSPKSIANGAKVLIEGTLLDQSPAQPNTPCVSKDSISAQMEYLHLQYPIDGLKHNVKMTGVQVALTAIDSNGQATAIGTTTTNAYYGTFSYEWTPPKEDKYTIIATFPGDDSYGSSGASTAISVGPAPSTPDTGQQDIVVPDYTMTIVYGVIAIIIAVVISVAIAVMILRKR